MKNSVNFLENKNKSLFPAIFFGHVFKLSCRNSESLWLWSYPWV